MPEHTYKVFTDSCADLTPELYKEAEIDVIPLSFEIDNKTYLNYPDGREMDSHTFFDKMRNKENPKTSQIPPGRYLEALTPILQAGQDVLLICFSSALSGTYNSAMQAKIFLKDNFPNRRVEVIDSLCASGGQGYLTYFIGLNRIKGMSLDDNIAWAESRILHIAHWFTIDDLSILKRGGRLSASKSFLGTLLKLKPVLHVDNLGRLVPVETVRGRKQSLLSIIKHYEDTAIEPDKNIVMIIHGDDIITAHYLGDMLIAKYHVPDVKYLMLGPVIGAHAGPNTISLFFIATER